MRSYFYQSQYSGCFPILLPQVALRHVLQWWGEESHWLQSNGERRCLCVHPEIHLCYSNMLLNQWQGGCLQSCYFYCSESKGRHARLWAQVRQGLWVTGYSRLQPVGRAVRLSPALGTTVAAAWGVHSTQGQLLGLSVSSVAVGKQPQHLFFWCNEGPCEVWISRRSHPLVLSWWVGIGGSVLISEDIT